jgi:hypothetical protein
MEPHTAGLAKDLAELGLPECVETMASKYRRCDQRAGFNLIAAGSLWVARQLEQKLWRQAEFDQWVTHTPYATSAHKWISQLFRTRSTNRMSHKITRAKAIMNVSVEWGMIITVSIFRIAQNARPIQRPFALNEAETAILMGVSSPTFEENERIKITRGANLPAP